MVDSVGTRIDDRTVREEVISASCDATKLDWMEETVRVDPVSEVKYPVTVDRVGTRIDDRTFREEVISASCDAIKLDWMEETVRVEVVKEVK